VDAADIQGIVMIYDVVIVGAGSAGIMAALEITSKSKLSVLLIEQVKRLHDSRNVSNGWFGGSAKSDVRIFDDNDFGGSVQTPALFKALTAHLKRHMNGNIRYLKNKLGKRELKGLQDLGIQVVEPNTYVIGSDKMIQIENSVQKELQGIITIKSNCRIERVDKYRGEFYLYSADDEVFIAKKCILALGRGGANWASSALQSMKIDCESTEYELGVRVEFPEKAASHFGSPNFCLRFGQYRTSTISTKCIVEMENVDELKTSNVRSITGKTTHSASVCLLKRFKSSTPLNDVVRLVKMANVLADEQLLREPASKWLTGNSVLSPIPEYASMKDGLNKLFDVFPLARKRANIYAPEARLNTVKFRLSNDMETNITGLYIAGDMSGHTSSFSQAGCSGIAAARHILKTRSVRSKKNVKRK
jgi:uncharacterized FAD-dependent dehydrogenase